MPGLRTSCGPPGLNPFVSGISLRLRKSHLESFPGDSFVFECEEGAVMKGSSGLTNDLNVVCKENGIWDFGTLRCACKYLNIGTD